jgi:hypothetical protein
MISINCKHLHHFMQVAESGRVAAASRATVSARPRRAARPAGATDTDTRTQ